MLKNREIFKIPYSHYSIDNWEEKKSKILDQLDDKFTDYGDYELPPYESIVRQNISNELIDFSSYLDFPLSIMCMWYERSKRSHRHPVHNHGGAGFSAVMYVEFNPEVHESTVLYSPYGNPFTGALMSYRPDVKEGDIIFFPSSFLHEARPNESDEVRTIISFNMFDTQLLFAKKHELFGDAADEAVKRIAERAYDHTPNYDK
jgi:hypothetical protein